MTTTLTLESDQPIDPLAAQQVADAMAKLYTAIREDLFIEAFERGHGDGDGWVLR